MKKKFPFSKVFMALIIFMFYLPLAVMVIYSFNESRISALWSGFSLTWYKQLFQNADLFEALRNSIVLAVLASLAAAVIGTLGAFGFTKIKARSKGAVETVSMLPLMTPEIILGMVFLAFFTLLGLPFGLTTLVLAHTAFCIPYVYMMVRARLVGMDRHLSEAARDLGASEVRVFFDITLPMLLPAILSGMLLSFAMSFDDVIISIFVTGAKFNTLPIKIYTQMRTGVSPEINALCALMLGVTLLVLLSAHLIKKLFHSA